MRAPGPPLAACACVCCFFKCVLALCGPALPTTPPCGAVLDASRGRGGSAALRQPPALAASLPCAAERVAPRHPTPLPRPSAGSGWLAHAQETSTTTGARTACCRRLRTVRGERARGVACVQTSRRRRCRRRGRAGRAPLQRLPAVHPPPPAYPLRPPAAFLREDQKPRVYSHLLHWQEKRRAEAAAAEAAAAQGSPLAAAAQGLSPAAAAASRGGSG